MEHVIETNRSGWEQRVIANHVYTRPIEGPVTASQAHSRLDPHAWVDWASIESVVCLAAGGGNWSPLFATLGLRTTVVDFSVGQLRRDRETNARLGLEVEIVEANVLDLHELYERKFDLVFMAVSDVYFPKMRDAYAEIGRIITPAGLFLAHLWNPVWMQIPDEGSWDGSAYRLEVVPTEGKALFCDEPDSGSRTIQFIHPLGELIGCLGETGFVIRRFAEENVGDPGATPTSFEHMASYVPPFFRVLSTYESQNKPVDATA